MILRRLLLETVFIFLLCCVAIGFLLFFDSPPSTKDLDDDLVQIRAAIAATTDESEKLSGGLLKAVIDLRHEISKSTEAMLEQKRASLIRRIDLKYVVEGQTLSKSTGEELDKIAKDLDAAKAKLEKSEAEAARYSGGLVQGLALMSVEIDKLLISQLTLSYFSKKYGMALPINFRLPNKAEELGPAGGVVKDKDAL